MIYSLIYPTLFRTYQQTDVMLEGLFFLCQEPQFEAHANFSSIHQNAHSPDKIKSLSSQLSG